jgi:hypothetical protein
MLRTSAIWVFRIEHKGNDHAVDPKDFSKDENQRQANEKLRLLRESDDANLTGNPDGQSSRKASEAD